VWADNGDPLLAALLLPAMSAGEPLEVTSPVSPRLLRCLEEIQAIFHCWYPALWTVPIRAPVRVRPQREEAAPRQVGLFFSLGVDSFYSLLKNVARHPDDEDTVGALIVVHGFDVLVGREDSGAFAQVLAHAREVGRELGKEVLPVLTNVRGLLDQWVDWGHASHGPALASVGLTLQGLFRRVLISASYGYADLAPWGSHPLLDPLWSTESLSFVHDGCEARRVEKIHLLARSPIALEHLRVCFEHPEAYNCCRCKKCLQTMVALHSAGTLGQSASFPRPLDAELLRGVRAATLLSLRYLEELLPHLGTSETDRAIREALQEGIARSRLGPGAPQVVHPGPRFWRDQLRQAAEELIRLIPAGERFILVDEERCRSTLDTAGRAVPFLERDGEYWGPPADDAQAVEELERLRRQGIPFVAFAWPAFWWLEHYAGLKRYLRANFPCLLENDRLVVFDLRRGPAS
jgi:hypothetical protein